MSDLVFAVVSPKGANERLREITLAWSRYGYHGEIVDALDVDQALSLASDTGAKFCLIQRAGHIIDEQWFLTHWQRLGFYQELDRLMTLNSFLVAGKCRSSSSGCTGLFEDCLLVDLRRYKEFGCPRFGDANSEADATRLLTGGAKTIREGSTVEDPGNVVTELPGWNFVQASLEQGLPIVGFTNSFNECRFDLSDADGAQNFIALMGEALHSADQIQNLTKSQANFINRVEKQFRDAKRGVFLFNIEPYNDLVECKSGEPLDAVFGVAAGFKPYRILLSKGFHPDTKIVLFDYSQKALDVWQHIAENWDGIDFPRFVRRIFNEFPSKEVFYQLWHGATPDTLNWDDLEVLWQQELVKWGGAEKFRQHWLNCQQLPREYLHCDLLQQRDQLLKSMSAHQRNYIWWSNAFFTINSHWHYRPSERKQQYLDWVSALAKASPNCLINGADHNNSAVNGVTASTYLNKFSRLYDELHPQKIHQVNIQF